MKNVQFIDDADNCTFSVFQFTDEQFEIIFSKPGQDIIFSEEMQFHLSPKEIERAFEGVWDRPIAKGELVGLHGTIFYNFGEKKKRFPNTRRECDWDDLSINQAQRELYARIRRQFDGS